MLIGCRCGCGGSVETPDARGRPRNFLRGHNVKKNGSNTARGADHHRWKAGERMVSSSGYAKLRVGKAHPLADPNGYAYEHIVVWVAAGNGRPTRSEVLHHVNENRLDNRLENLRLLSRSAHNAIHIVERRRDTAGRLLDGALHDEFPGRFDDEGDLVTRAEPLVPDPWVPDLGDAATAGVLLGMLPRGMLVYDHGDEDGWEIREPMAHGSRSLGKGATLGVAAARALLATWGDPAPAGRGLGLTGPT